MKSNLVDIKDKIIIYRLDYITKNLLKEKCNNRNRKISAFRIKIFLKHVNNLFFKYQLNKRVYKDFHMMLYILSILLRYLVIV